MESYGGIDLHSNNSYLGIVNEENRVMYKDAAQKRAAPHPLRSCALQERAGRQSRWNRPSTGTGSSMGYSMPATPSISPTPLP